MEALPYHLCPLCGGANQCAPARAGSLDVPCWCTTAAIHPLALMQIPADLLNKACLCPRCAAGLDLPAPKKREPDIGP
ncbi:MAG TPA: cysteine-rich CWC family protein [Aquabacterium sp.]|uniref:cysteine-rich CWC family protein n=1 Tax=Aquabacterium sp. TaxID=1872578 RepID=UPI002E365498|nr:cysteine-rich CWC family protein [Aquabacterium sp.]HEX5358003.1 cysteine-rich CWC family protein [Aquabacterium sp.]